MCSPAKNVFFLERTHVRRRNRFCCTNRKSRRTHIRDFKIQRKKHSFKKPSNNFARASHFLYISLPFLHEYNVKMPNFAFPGEHKQATTKFYFSFGTWIWSLGIQLQKGLLTFDKVSR